jgi:hypothetical protein
MQPGENQKMKPILLSKGSKSKFNKQRNSPVSCSWKSSPEWLRNSCGGLRGWTLCHAIDTSTRPGTALDCEVVRKTLDLA